MLRRALVSIAIVLGATDAAAAPLPPDVERSVMLYEQGRKLVEGGDCAKATALFEESNRYNESIGAHLSIAECKSGDPLGAWREFKRAETLARRKQDDRATYARDHAAALHPRLALVQVALPPGSVTRALVDATTAAESNLDEPFAVEPGTHLVELVRADGTRVSQRIDAKVGTIARVTGESAAPAPPPAAAPAPSGARKTIGLVLMAAGAPIAITGGVFGFIAMSKMGDAEDLCPAYPSCAQSSAPAARDLNDEGRSAALVSSIGLGVGLVALAAGVVLYLTAPSTSTARATPDLRF